MATRGAADAALAATLMAGSEKLILTRFSKKQAIRSTGGMGKVASQEAQKVSMATSNDLANDVGRHDTKLVAERSLMHAKLEMMDDAVVAMFEREYKSRYAEFEIQAVDVIEEEQLRIQFERADTNESGTLSGHDLAKITPFGRKLTPDELPLRPDGQISYAEFMTWWEKGTENAAGPGAFTRLSFDVGWDRAVIDTWQLKFLSTSMRMCGGLLLVLLSVAAFLSIGILEVGLGAGAQDTPRLSAPSCADDPSGSLTAVGGCAAFVTRGCDSLISVDPVSVPVSELCPLSCNMCGGEATVLNGTAQVGRGTAARQAAAQATAQLMFFPEPDCVLPDAVHDAYIWMMIAVVVPASFMAAVLWPLWLLSLTLGVTFAADDVADVMADLKPSNVPRWAAESEATHHRGEADGVSRNVIWQTEVSLPAAMLVETMRELSAWGTSMGAAIVGCWVAALCWLPVVYESTDVDTTGGTVALAAIAALPLLVASMPAWVSTSCDLLFDQLNDISFMVSEVLDAVSGVCVMKPDLSLHSHSVAGRSKSQTPLLGVASVLRVLE